MKIIDNRKPTEKETHAVGDWVEVTHRGTKYLCVIAQTSGGMVQLICIDVNEANRVSEPMSVSTGGGTHQKLSQEWEEAQKGLGFQLEKVSVTVTINHYQK